MNEQYAEPGVELVDADEIITLSKFQVRTKLDTKKAREYATAMKAGARLPPVRLARIKGKLVLVDGWHRIEARRQLAKRSKNEKERETWQMIPAIIESMSERDARWASAKANLTHGVPLNRREKARVFDLYMRTRRYLKSNGTSKSSREISRDLEGSYSHTTVLARIKRDYPKVYEAMRQLEDEPMRYEGGPPPRQPEEQHMMRDDALSLIEEVRGAVNLVSDPGERRAIYEAAKALVAELEADGVPEPDEF